MAIRRRWIAALAALAFGLQALLAPAQALATIGALSFGGLGLDGICFAPGDRDRAPLQSPAGTAHGHVCILCPALDGPTALLLPGGELQAPPAHTADSIGPADIAIVIAVAFRPPSRAPPLA